MFPYPKSMREQADVFEAALRNIHSSHSRVPDKAGWKTSPITRRKSIDHREQISWTLLWTSNSCECSTWHFAPSYVLLKMIISFLGMPLQCSSHQMPSLFALSRFSRNRLTTREIVSKFYRLSENDPKGDILVGIVGSKEETNLFPVGQAFENDNPSDFGRVNICQILLASLPKFDVTRWKGTQIWSA